MEKGAHMSIVFERGQKDKDELNGGTDPDRRLQLLLQLFPPAHNRVEPTGPDRYRVFPKQGGELSITPDKIALNNVKTDHHETYKATMLLIKATWGSAVVSNGTKDDHLMAIAHGRAAGVKITSADEGKFTKE